MSLVLDKVDAVINYESFYQTFILLSLIHRRMQSSKLVLKCATSLCVI